MQFNLFCLSTLPLKNEKAHASILRMGENRHLVYLWNRSSQKFQVKNFELRAFVNQYIDLQLYDICFETITTINII